LGLLFIVHSSNGILLPPSFSTILFSFSRGHLRNVGERNTLLSTLWVQHSQANFDSLNFPFLQVSQLNLVDDCYVDGNLVDDCYVDGDLDRPIARYRSVQRSFFFTVPESGAGSAEPHRLSRIYVPNQTYCNLSGPASLMMDLSLNVCDGPML